MKIFPNLLCLPHADEPFTIQVFDIDGFEVGSVTPRWSSHKDDKRFAPDWWDVTISYDNFFYTTTGFQDLSPGNYPFDGNPFGDRTRGVLFIMKWYSGNYEK